MGLLLPSADELERLIAPTLARITSATDTERKEVAHDILDLLATVNADLQSLEKQAMSDVATVVEKVVSELAEIRKLIEPALQGTLEITVPGLAEPIMIRLRPS